jgi:hypothetical protein
VLSFPEGSQVINIDNLTGVTITDRACFATYGGRRIEDVAMVGAWHGNNDGPDRTDNCVIRNCFLMAHDDNLFEIDVGKIDGLDFSSEPQ